MNTHNIQLIHEKNLEIAKKDKEINELRKMLQNNTTRSSNKHVTIQEGHDH